MSRSLAKRQSLVHLLIALMSREPWWVYLRDMQRYSSFELKINGTPYRAVEEINYGKPRDGSEVVLNDEKGKRYIAEPIVDYPSKLDIEIEK